MITDPKDITPAEPDYDVTGLDTTDDYDTGGLETKPDTPEFSMGRLGGAFYENIKEFPANVARTVRSFTEASDPYPIASESDSIYDKKDVFMDSFARYGAQDKIRVQNRQNEFMSEGMPKNEAFKKALLENRADSIQQYNDIQKRRQGQVEEGLEFLGQVEQQFKKSKEFETSSGFVEDVAGGIGTSLPSLVGAAVGGPVLSSALMYSQLHGSKIKELEDLGVTEPDAKLKSAIFSAAAQTPFETVSNLFMLSKVMKANGTWTNWLLHTIEGMGGEGLTEFVQQYPDSYATIMALNPDVSQADLLKWAGNNIGDLTKDALYAGAVGAVSGGIMTGAGAAGKIQIDRYIHPEQKVKNEERNARGAVLVDKVEKGTATPEQQAELASMLGAGPDADINKIVKDVKKNLVLNQPIQTPEREAAHEAMTSKLGADVADIEMGVFDAMARSWADRTGKTPDAFYTDVVGLRLEDDGAGNEVLIQDTVGTEASLFQATNIVGENFKNWFGDSKVLDESGKPMQVFHGTQRPDRVGNRFMKSRATSGPMAFFTDEPEVASGYASGKSDNSLNIDTLEKFFFVSDEKGKKKAQGLNQIWYSLSQEQRQSLKDKLPNIGENEETSEIEYQENGGLYSSGWDYEVKRNNGNWLQAAYEIWINSGTLLRQEENFTKVLKLAGVDNVDFDDPYAVKSAIIPVFLSIKNPLDTTNIPENVIGVLEREAKRKRSKGMGDSSDPWNKNNRDAKDWVQELKKDIERGKNSYVWSSIPDWVTKTLQRLGYDGIKDLGNKGSNGKQHHVWIPFEENQVKSSIGNRGTYDPKSKNILRQEDTIDSENARGVIEDLFGDGPALIKLFAGADVSTPIHEVGHLGLKLLHQSGDTDYNVLAEFAGVDFERSKMGPGEWTREEHEKVAKAFETYIMEGKSPTTRLQMAFAKLKGWLLDIYKTIKAHGVELNDDVRSVFDRLLTTQYERDSAPYMEVQEWVSVADLAGGATSLAEAEIVKSEFARRSLDAAQFAGMEYDELVGQARELELAKVAKKRQTQEKRVKAQFKKEAVRSIETEPFFAMMDEIMKAGGLKYDNVIGLYSPEWIGELNRQRGGVVSHEGRAYADDIATQYGYESADDMLQDILNKPGKQEAIDSYYNDLVREYESTLHYQDADLYAQVLEQEADILRRMVGKPAVDKKIKGTVREKTGQMKTPELKELASQFKRDEQVARNAWNKARKQTRDEERAAATEKRGEAVGKEKARQLEKIMKIKLKQVAAMQTLRDDYKAKREIKDIQDRVNKVVRMDSIPYSDKTQIANFVSEYIPLPPTVRGNTPEMSLDEFLDMRHEGNEYIVDALKIALTHKPQQRFNKAGYRVPLALDEWRVVGDIVTMIHKMSVMEKNLIGAYEKANIDNLVLDMAKEAYGVWGTPNAPLQPIEQLEELRSKTGWFDRMSKSTRGYLAWVAKPQFVFDALGGYKTNMLDTKNYLPWMMIEKASDGELKQGKPAMKQLTDIFNWIKKPTQWANQKQTVTGFSAPITKEHMVMIALNSGNDGNLKALREGLSLTDEQIENVKKALSSEETQMVEKIWDFLEQFYPKLNQLNIDLTGVPLKKVEGNYFPLVPNVALHEKAEMLAAKAADVNMRAHAYSQPKVNWGSRHERTGMVMAPELRLSVISNHVAQVLHDINFQIPVRNVKKIINHPDYRYMAKETIGEAAYNQLTPWLVHVGNPRGEPVVEVDKMVRRLRENSTIVGMGFRAIQILDQMIGFTNTIPDVGIPNMMKAMYHFGTKPNETARFIKESSPMMDSFESSWDRDMQEAFSKFDPKTFGKPDWLREAFFIFSRVPDRICKNVAWMSAYFKGNELYSNNHEKAVAYANEILVSTQGSGLPKDLSTFQRGGPKRSEWVKLATMFQTFFSVLVNQVFRVGSRFKLGEIGLVKMLEAYTFLIAIPSLFSFILRKRGLPEGDEWLKAPISFLTAGFPIVRDIISPWASGYRYQATPAAAGLETAARLLERLGGEHEDDKWQGKALKEAFKLSGFIWGLPTGQALTTADGLMDLANGKTNDPTSIFWRQDKPKKVAPHL